VATAIPDEVYRKSQSLVNLPTNTTLLIIYIISFLILNEFVIQNNDFDKFNQILFPCHTTQRLPNINHSLNLQKKRRGHIHSEILLLLLEYQYLLQSIFYTAISSVRTLHSSLILYRE